MGIFTLSDTVELKVVPAQQFSPLLLLVMNCHIGFCPYSTRAQAILPELFLLKLVQVFFHLGPSLPSTAKGTED